MAKLFKLTFLGKSKKDPTYEEALNCLEVAETEREAVLRAFAGILNWYRTDSFLPNFSITENTLVFDKNQRNYETGEIYTDDVLTISLTSIEIVTE